MWHSTFTADPNKIFYTATLLIVSLGAVRFVGGLLLLDEYEMGMLFGPWLVFIAIQVALWLVPAGALLGLLALCIKRKWRIWLPLMGLAIWSTAILWASWVYFDAAAAMADARSNSTSPARLRALLHYDEVVDRGLLYSRLAANPSTPLDLLTEVAKKDPVGTELSLASNRNSPPEMLEHLANSGQENVRRAVAANPSTPASTLTRLSAVTDETIRRAVAHNPSTPKALAEQLIQELPR